jgi:ABC-type uncharacterized transport system substrate-binding protein
MLHLFIGLMSFMMLFFSGCAFFTPPKQHPVQYDWVPISKWWKTRYGSVFSMTPERRTVIVIPEPSNTFRICAEPPPDVAESLASTIRFAAEAQVKGQGGKVDLSSIFSSSAMMLFYRSQGVQLFRDGMYNLCQAHMNGIISKEQYVEKYKELLDVAEKLIGAEIPAMQAIKIAEAAARTREKCETTTVSLKFSGKIKSVDAGTKNIVVTSTDGKAENTFVVDEKTKITKGTTDLPFAELKPEMLVAVEYKKEGDKMIATAIKVSDKPAVSLKFSGKIKSVDAGTKNIVVTSNDGKAENTFVVDEKTKITKGTTDLPFAELKPEMLVVVEYKKEGDKMIATAISVRSESSIKEKIIEEVTEKVKSLSK